MGFIWSNYGCVVYFTEMPLERQRIISGVDYIESIEFGAVYEIIQNMLKYIRRIQILKQGQLVLALF